MSSLEGRQWPRRDMHILCTGHVFLSAACDMTVRKTSPELRKMSTPCCWMSLWLGRCLSSTASPGLRHFPQAVKTLKSERPNAGPGPLLKQSHGTWCRWPRQDERHLCFGSSLNLGWEQEIKSIHTIVNPRQIIDLCQMNSLHEAINGKEKWKMSDWSWSYLDLTNPESQSKMTLSTAK